MNNLEYCYTSFAIILSLIIKQLNNKERNSLNKQFKKILDILETEQKIEDVIYNEDLNSKSEMIEKIKNEIRLDKSLPEYFIQMMSMIQNPNETTFTKYFFSFLTFINFIRYLNSFTILIHILGVKFFLERLK